MSCVCAVLPQARRAAVALVASGAVAASLLTGTAPASAAPVPAAAPSVSTVVGPLLPTSTTYEFRQRVLYYAAKYAGTPYLWGGTSPSTGFDCSGYTKYVYGKAGRYIPRTSREQRAYTTRLSRDALRPGDLVFVHNSYGTVYHVAIFAGRSNGVDYWWEASRPGVPVGKHRAWSTRVSYGRP